MAINLLRVDTAPIEYLGEIKVEDDQSFSDFSAEFKRWLGVFVDDFNQNMEDLEGVLLSLDARLTAGGL